MVIAGIKRRQRKIDRLDVGAEALPGPDFSRNTKRRGSGRAARIAVKLSQNLANFPAPFPVFTGGRVGVRGLENPYLDDYGCSCATLQSR